MSLKQTAEIRRYTNKDGVDVIQDIILRNVRFNYTFLTKPQESAYEGRAGSYSTNVIINDQATWETYWAAFSEVYNYAVTNVWGGKKLPLDKINTPFYFPKTKDDGTYYDFEEGALAGIKASTTKAPDLYINVAPHPIRQADENDIDEFYSGMIGDIIISFWAYDKAPKRPKPGIKAILKGVSKTAVGDPLIFHEDNLLEAFAGPNSNVAAFGSVPQPTTGFGATGFATPTAPVVTPTAPVVTPAAPVVTPAAPVVTPAAAPNLVQPSTTVEPITPVVEQAPANLLQDLLGNIGK